MDGDGSTSDAAIRTGPAAGMNAVLVEERVGRSWSQVGEWAYEKS
jgi:hypothetical protein